MSSLAVADMALYRRRRWVNSIVVFACTGATLVGVSWLALIVAELLIQGVPGLSLSTFSERTRMSGGGLGNAIVGSLMMTAAGTVIGTIVGVAAGTWLAEYGRDGRLASIIRFISDILLSAPSIIVGLFIYAIMVQPLGHFSGWAGGVALAIILLPVVVRTTEDQLGLVPQNLREAASALGAHRWLIVTKVCYSGARVGIITGVLLGCARISGETAPLIFTSLNSNQWTTNMNDVMANLPMTIYQNMTINSFIPDLVQLAWTGGLLLTIAILLLNIIARFAAR
ncbi:phosphate ABC transporter permease PstA [Salinisphaera aquimarina]|uniref:Phosphate transport system permease protein PstA n=1 Tax=Salinisphaera aquimarina TaxID=2094031 RepID=A0ABV7EMJ5_9GAMM